jgi:probable DNA metabolism protein
MEKIYLYDGTFQDLLTTIFVVFEDIRKGWFQLIDICPADGWQRLLGDTAEVVNVENCAAKFERVEKGIIKKLGRSTLDIVYTVYLSDDPKRGILIYEYLEYGFRVGRELNSHLADERVMKMFELDRKVSNEHHRLCGFARFKDIGNGVLYCEIEPATNVIELLMLYFYDRMPSQKFIIADIKRKRYGIYNEKQIVFTDHIPDDIIRVKDVNSEFEDLWKKFFNAIAIEERMSTKRQMLHMPRKYWKHIIEKV